MKLLGRLSRARQADDSPARRRQLHATEAPIPRDTPPDLQFRRGRTMTAQSSLPEVSERARLHHLRRLRRRLLLWLAIALVSATGLLVLLGQYTGRVEIVTSGEASLKAEADRYSAAFEQYYAAFPFERLRFLTNTERLLGHLQSTAPEVVSVAARGSAGLGVSRYGLEFRQPVASWSISSERYYVDTAGVTFRHNYFDEPVVSVLDNSGARPEQGEAVASGRLLAFVGRVVSLAGAEGVAIQSVEIPAGAMRRVVVHVEGRPPAHMTIDRAEGAQVADMRSAFAFLEGRGETAEYIDVRAPGKVFYLQ